jgi:4-amino-4-deoxy-L-arabinose transferase-like glycosyltransferase
MLSSIERWFEPVQASQDYERQDYVLLILILAVGTMLRFWNLGNVGLHGDEDIMGLAVRGIVAQGIPILPSDLIYLRAPLHTYLVAGSTLLFGDNEWSLRLPSAIVGSLCGLFAFFMGRRFLGPKQNLVFVALITFLPVMIEVSKTARMYVFFIACLLVFGLLLFRWERARTTMSLLSASFVLLLSIQFHQLAVFAAPLLLYPGLANRSWKQTLQGAIALASALIFSELFTHFAHRSYPEESERLVLEAEEGLTPLDLLFQGNFRLAIAVAIGVAVAVIMIGTIRMDRRRATLPATVLLAIGAASCSLLHYHIGAIAVLFGTIAWLRAGSERKSRLLIIAAGVGLMALMQFYILRGTGEFGGRQIIGAFVGTPSIWPTLRFIEFSAAGVAVLAVTLGFAAYRLAQGRRVPIHFLFFAMAVWAPLFGLGFFSWDVATRYTMGAMPFFLLAVPAGVTYLIQSTGWGGRLRDPPIAARAAGVVLIAAIVNPTAAWQVAGNNYEDHPDHKGAAEFIQSLNPGPADILIAEDSIVQTYYLGRVDYRLQNVAGARNHSVLRNGVLYGQYTGTPVIGSGRQLEAILDRELAGSIYIISSNHGSASLQRRNRKNGIAEVLASDRLEVVYVGRDHKTRVWKLRRQS